MDEQELVARVRAADPGAERALYDAHVDRIYRMAYRMAGDESLAREYTQDTFVRAFERIDQFRGDASLHTWLRAIAMSVILNGLRKVKRLRQREVGLEAAVGVGTGSRIAEPDLKERLRSAIEGLPTKYRAVFVMHDIEGYTHEEIGAALKVPVGTTKAQLSRARARLRETLAPFAQEWAT